MLNPKSVVIIALVLVNYVYALGSNQLYNCLKYNTEYANNAVVVKTPASNSLGLFINGSISINELLHTRYDNHSALLNDEAFYKPLLSYLYPNSWQKVLGSNCVIEGVMVPRLAKNANRNDSISYAESVCGNYHSYLISIGERLLKINVNYLYSMLEWIYNKHNRFSEELTYAANLGQVASTIQGFIKSPAAKECQWGFYYVSKHGEILDPTSGTTSQGDSVEWYVSIQPHSHKGQCDTKAHEITGKSVKEVWDTWVLKKMAAGCTMLSNGGNWWADIKIIHQRIAQCTSWEDINCSS